MNPGPSSGPAPVSTEAPEVVVAEDDGDIGRLLKFLLEREGFRVTLCADGRIAAERLGGQAMPALVILDVMLPYLNGYQLLQQVRARPEWNSVPVLMLTAKSRESDIARALDGGATDYMAKPFQPAELKARVRRLLAAPA